MKYAGKGLLCSIVLSGVFAGGAYSASTSDTSKPKNIIFVVGDGMGPAFTTAYRMFADDPTTDNVENTVFDRILVGMASTHPDYATGYVTDSAASATALATGIKTYNGAIGVDVNKQQVLTVLERAKQNGMKTGVAVTSQINHATPAGFSVKNVDREEYDQIADSYFDHKINGKFVLDVMLGGGWKYFKRKDRDLTREFQTAGYQYVDSLKQLSTVAPNKPLLGLFADVAMPWALDSPAKMRLPILAKAAVKQLEGDEGFFLLVEASLVDWAGHANDIGAAMTEMHDLALTMEWLEGYVEQNPDTLVVLTADHSTGGLTIGKDAKYAWSPEYLRGLSVSPWTMAEQLVNSDDRATLASALLGFELSKAESSKLSKAKGEKDLYTALRHILNERSRTGWTTRGHTGVDVQVFAMGKGAAKFSGYSDNTDLAKKVFSLLD